MAERQEGFLCYGRFYLFNIMHHMNAFDTKTFRGTWTALILPLTEDDTIDYPAIERMVEEQVLAGVTGILVIGTTGESPTLNCDESDELVRRVKAKIAGRCLLMVGCGTNSTRKSVDKAIRAEKNGADVLLVVNPYYNKPTQEGLYLHFKAVAEATGLPLLVYNIKGRTGVNVETDTLFRIVKDCPTVVGVKEASGDLQQIQEVCDKRPQGFVVLSGDDGITEKVMEEYGADGVISVASNIMPREVNEMVQCALKGEFEKARALDIRLQRLFKDLFVETNPIPVKYAAYKRGHCGLKYRLPMCPPSPKARAVLNDMLKEYNLI